MTSDAPFLDELPPHAGVALGTLDGEARRLARRLVSVYLQRLVRPLASHYLEEVLPHMLGDLRFAWAGATEPPAPGRPGPGHYYRLQGPRFLAELDNTQNGANHVHTVWRDPTATTPATCTDPRRGTVGARLVARVGRRFGVPVSEIPEALSYDDVLLVPLASAVLPRDVDIATRLHERIHLNLPLLSAAMDKVTEADMAVALARQGGIGVIHKNNPIEAQAAMVESVKRSESGFILDPVTLQPQDPVDTAFELMARYKVSGFPVVDDAGHLVGIVTNRDLRLDTESGHPVSEYMTTQRLVTAQPGTTLDQARDLMQQYRVEKLPIVTEDGLLTGMFTFKDIEKVRTYPSAAKDARGRLLCAAAVGVGPEGEERAEALAAAGVDLLAIDSSHGHAAGILEFAAKLKDRLPDIVLMVGNVATGDAVRACADHGADIVKVGVGPGSICTTRVVTGVGMPQFSAVMDSAEAAMEIGIASVADGGVRYSGDLVKALAAGATAVMVGNLLAGTDESPGEQVLVGGRRYKEYRGMGSIDAMRAGSADRYFQNDKLAGSAREAAAQPSKLVPEGVSGLLPYRGALAEVTAQLEGGLRAGMGLVGAPDLPTLASKAKFVRQSGAGARESHVHDLDVVHEAPNYSVPGKG